MSRIFKTAVLAAWFGIASPTLADGLPAALTPPFPKVSLSSPNLPLDNDMALARFATTPIPSHDQQVPIADIVARQANISNFGTACGPSLSMDVAIDAMLAVKVHAPCLPYDTIRLEHEGLTFTVPMPMTGELFLLLPALSENAVVQASLSDGTILSASADVPDALNFARVALQWSGTDPGELVAKIPKVLDGSVIRLGQSIDADGAVLHVFSSRINEPHATGVVRLSMRASVTAENCDTGHESRVRRRVPGEPTSTYDLMLKGSGCDAIGESLELKNVLQDLKLTRN